MATVTVKLQRIGNSIRATIPREIVDDLSLSRGQDMTVSKIDNDSVLFKKKKKNKESRGPIRFYGILKEKTGPVEHWPTVEEIKNIWE